MQYDEPITAQEFNQLLAQNPSLSGSAIASINLLLGIPTTGPSTPVAVANATFNPATGELTVESPDGAIDAVLIDLSNATTDQVLTLTGALAQAGVIIIESDVGVTVTFNTVERVIVAGNGNDFITVNGDRNTTLDGGNGNDTLITSGGNDSIIASQGNDSISTGAGDDVINAFYGHDTIDGGTGYDVVQMAAPKSSYNMSVENGALVIAGANSATVNNAEFIAFGGETTGLVATGNVNVAAAIRMYEALLDRNAELGGAKFWTGIAESGAWTTAQIAEFFLNSPEFVSRFGDPDDLSNEEFVDIVYQNVLGREAEAGGLNFWTNILDTDAYSRAQVTVFISGSDEAAVYTGVTGTGTVQYIDGWI